MDVSFFTEMAWKSALIAGAALGLAFILRSRAAADRALVLRLGVAMLLLLPVIALALPALKIEAWSAPPAAAPPPEMATVVAPRALPPLELQAPAPLGADTTTPPAHVLAPTPQLPAAAGQQPAPPTIWDDPTPLVLLAYLGGLAMVGARLLAGLWLLRGWTRAARPIDDPDWLAAFERARWAAPDGERVRLLVSESVPSPLSWGWRQPAILIDPDTLAEAGEADAILAHEFAHIARNDWPVLMLSRIAATLFWFNPLVWLLEREIVQQAEEAADCEATMSIEPTDYARTLLSLAQVNGRLVPANSIAPKGSALARRIRVILDRRLRERPSGSGWTALAAMACIFLAGPIAATQLVAATRAPTPPAAPEAQRAPLAPVAPEAPVAPLAPIAPEAPRPPRAPVAPEAPSAPTADLGDLANVGPAVQQAMAEVTAQLPAIIAEASQAAGAIDPEQIQRSVDQALAAAGPEMRHMSSEDRARIHAEIRRALDQARAARQQVMVVDRDQIRRAMEAAQGAQRRVMVIDRARMEAAMQQARRAAEIAPRAIAIASAAGGGGMARGADGMEAGAHRMEEQAARFHDRDYRAHVIAEEAARGHHVTDEDLLQAARGMEEGARGMREGARAMRDAARHMGGSTAD